MSHSLVCWNCGASLAALTLPLRRLEVCPQCSSELHVCRMCVEYDTAKAKHCREPIAEEVRDKQHANFCDFFKPREAAYVAPDAAALAGARAGLDALFGAAQAGGKPSQPQEPGKPGAPGPAAATTVDEARARLDELFKSRKD